MVKKITLEDLASMVAEGFNTVHEEFVEVKARLSGLEQDVSVLKQDVSALKQDVAILKYDVSALKQDVLVLKQSVNGLEVGQERIETTLRQVAWQNDYREMDYRVKKLEGARATA